MNGFPSDHSTWSKAKRELSRIFMLLIHQLSAAVGVLGLAGLLTGVVLGEPRLWGHAVQIRYVYTVLTGTPYFPIEIFVGMVWGWVIGRKTRQPVVLWVWVFPLFALCWALLESPPTYVSDIIPGAEFHGYTRFSHFFGWGCRTENRCFDQVVTTLPFYTSVAYSIGAWLARTLSVGSRLVNKVQYWILLATGLIILTDTASGM